MTIMETTYKHNNPIALNNHRINALDEAYQIFLTVLDEYIQKNDLNPEDIKEIKNALVKAYNEKKISYYLDNKFDKFTNYIDYALGAALTNLGQSKENREFKNIFYLKHTKQLLTNEQY
jgi:hypothetical protein